MRYGGGFVYQNYNCVFVCVREYIHECMLIDHVHVRVSALQVFVYRICSYARAYSIHFGKSMLTDSVRACACACAGCHVFSAAEQQQKEVQRGVFRTNCKDCLDRTNIVQSLIARHALEAHFKRVCKHALAHTLFDMNNITHVHTPARRVLHTHSQANVQMTTAL